MTQNESSLCLFVCQDHKWAAVGALARTTTTGDTLSGCKERLLHIRSHCFWAWSNANGRRATNTRLKSRGEGADVVTGGRDNGAKRRGRVCTYQTNDIPM